MNSSRVDYDDALRNEAEGQFMMLDNSRASISVYKTFCSQHWNRNQSYSCTSMYISIV